MNSGIATKKYSYYSALSPKNTTSVPCWLHRDHVKLSHMRPVSLHGDTGTGGIIDLLRNDMAARTAVRPEYTMHGGRMTDRENSVEQVARFVASFLQLSRNGKPRKASDIAFDFFNDHFEQDEFAECDLALDLIGSSNHSILCDIVIVALLAVTLPAARYLSARKTFIGRITQQLVSVAGVADAELILGMYR